MDCKRRNHQADALLQKMRRSTASRRNHEISRSVSILLGARDMSILTYKDLDTWKQGMDLVERCYRATAAFRLQAACDSVGRLLNGLYRSLELKLANCDSASSPW